VKVQMFTQLLRVHWQSVNEFQFSKMFVLLAARDVIISICTAKNMMRRKKVHNRDELVQKIEFVLSMNPSGLSVSQICRSISSATGASYWTINRVLEQFEGEHWHKVKMPQCRNVKIFTLVEQPEGVKPHDVAKLIKSTLPTSPKNVVRRLRAEAGIMPSITRDILKRGEGYLWYKGLISKCETMIIDKGIQIP